MTNKTCLIKELSTFVKRGITPAYTDQKKVKVINQKCIRNFDIDLSLAKYTDTDKRKFNIEKYLQPYDILINSTGVGTLGRVAQIYKIDCPTTVDSHVTILRPNNKKIDPLYFGYVVKSKEKLIESLAEGSTGQTELSRTQLEVLEIEILNDLKDQKSCGQFLKNLDLKINLNHKINQRLEEIVKLFFKSWFIDFDPVRAKSEGRSTGLSKEINDLFPNSFENSELGEIPKGYEIKRLDEIADFQNGYAFKSNEYVNNSENAIEVFRMGYIKRGGGFKEDDSPVFVSTLSQGNHKKYKLFKNDMTIAMTDMKNNMVILGCCAFIEEDKRFLLNQRVGRIRILDTNLVNPLFLYNYMNYPKNVELLRTRANSGVQVNLSTEAIKETKILIPSIEIMKKFSDITFPLYEKFILNNKEIKVLKKIRSILLSKLISGTLKISNGEKVTKEVGFL